MTLDPTTDVASLVPRLDSEAFSVTVIEAPHSQGDDGGEDLGQIVPVACLRPASRSAALTAASLLDPGS